MGDPGTKAELLDLDELRTSSGLTGRRHLLSLLVENRPGVLLTDKTTLVDDLRTALATPGPVVVDVKVTREENTYPMIAPGAAAREMVG